MKKIKKRGGGSEPVNITDHTTTIDSQQSTLPLPLEQKQEHKRKPRGTSRILWTDVEGKGTIREYKDGLIRYYYLPPGHEQPIVVQGDTVKLIKFAEYFRQTNYNLKQRNQCKEKAGIGRYTRGLGRHITTNGVSFRVIRQMDYTNYSWGSWKNKEDAIQVRDWLEEHDWPLELSTRETGLRGYQYQAMLREKIRKEHKHKKRG